MGASEGFLGWVAYLGAANAGVPLSIIVKQCVHLAIHLEQLCPLLTLYLTVHPNHPQRHILF